MTRPRALCCALALAATPSLAWAQAPAIQSVTAIELGLTASAPTGNTVFTAAASSGTVTRISGTGYRITNAPARALVTLSCDSNPLCATEPVLVTVTAPNATTGRMGQLANLTIAANSVVILVPATSGNPVSFTIAPIGQNASQSFYVGADIAILGNNSGQPTGAATAVFQVDAEIVAADSDADMGQATASVFRPIVVTAGEDLAFGTIVGPSAGAGHVEIDAATGVRSLTGTGVTGIGPAPQRAEFDVSGEGGQVFSVTLPPSFDMTGPGDPIEVTLETDATGPQSLSSGIGAGGTDSFNVGGAFDLSPSTPPGVYSGVFTVAVDYN